MGERVDEILIEYLREYRAGVDESFTRFYEATKYSLFYALIDLTRDEEFTKDVMQETYVRFLNNIDNLKTRHNPLAYLITIGRNYALDELRKRNVQNENINKTLKEETYDVDTPDFSDELLNKMSKLLTHDEFEIVVLKVLSDLTHKEIAKILHKKLGTVTWSYNNAIAKLQKGLSDYEIK
jgi:RNA polymerase sigma-70 factor (ECF subfamily)